MDWLETHEKEELPTIGMADLEGKTVVLRLDLNSPMVGNRILDVSRFLAHLKTLRDLADSKVVILAHQSRPGKSDFTTLEAHALKLGDILGRDVYYVDDIFGNRALERIKNLQPGEILLLENVRFYSEEVCVLSPEHHAKTHLVRRLSGVSDVYVNDAFSASHRPHASIVGFPPVLPSFAGWLMEKEISALARVMGSKESKIFILGGAKIDDSVKVMRNILENKIASKVILTGLMANYCLMLKGFNIGTKGEDLVNSAKSNVNDDVVRKLLGKYDNVIMLPVDVGVLDGEERKEIKIEELKDDHVIMDIGVESIARFSEEIQQYYISVINGPAGVFEDERFSLGTFELLRSMCKTSFSFVGGGHISTAAKMAGLERKITHVSTGGGASLLFLSGEPLIGVEMIKKYWNEKWKKKFS